MWTLKEAHVAPKIIRIVGMITITLKSWLDKIQLKCRMELLQLVLRGINKDVKKNP